MLFKIYRSHAPAWEYSLRRSGVAFSNAEVCRMYSTPERGTMSLIRWFPSSSLGTQTTKLQLRETGSWSFPHRIPKLELGN